ncbi:hypothetical protein ESCO_006576 [Escovopsis weberi]|uniref:Uncharacterized protein n=1 Tax=Escovopsis weberi TaxID=150374 RepID=A0A0M8N137_ESCWE|nr:hypothetical protein ESCO_006576 [Escovopsis weberi]
MNFKLLILTALAAGGPAAAVNLGRPEAVDGALNQLEEREELLCIYDDPRCRRGAGSCGLQCCSSRAVCTKTGNKCRTGISQATCS